MYNLFKCFLNMCVIFEACIVIDIQYFIIYFSVDPHSGGPKTPSPPSSGQNDGPVLKGDDSP